MTRLFAFLLVVGLAVHAALGWQLTKARPWLGVLPPLPTESATAALSLGDAQLLYRALVLQVQNAGDSGGRAMPMRDYDMNQVIPWLSVLQRLDVRSSHYSALAARYFTIMRTPADLRRLVDFIDRDVDLAFDRKWYWQTQAVAIARDRLHDREYALALSRKLAAAAPLLPGGYMWVLQLEPVLLFDLGRNDEAREKMVRIVASYGARMTDGEKNWTRSFLEKLH